MRPKPVSTLRHSSDGATSPLCCVRVTEPLAGATASKPGLFEVADGGSLFIDELGELAAPLQAKLLRVLEDGHLRRVGSTREQRVDVTIIAETHRNLDEEFDRPKDRERRHFERILKREGSSRVRAVEVLGIHRRSWYRLIDKYGIEIAGKAEKESSDSDE